jgi:hypothetical protein
MAMYGANFRNADEAACKGMNTNIFYPDDISKLKEPKEICKRCTLKVPCLVYALENNEPFGIWGGESERGRQRMRKELGIKAKRRPPVLSALGQKSYN